MSQFLRSGTPRVEHSPTHPNLRNPAKHCCPVCSSKTHATNPCYRDNFRRGSDMDIGYARIATTKQNLARQLDALAAAGSEIQRIYVDTKSGDQEHLVCGVRTIVAVDVGAVGAGHISCGDNSVQDLPARAKL